MNIRTIHPSQRIDYTFKTIELDGRVPGTDSIEFLRVEEPYWQGYRLGPFVRVRYARNGVEQKDAFPLDVDKGIFLHIYDEDLAEKLQPIAPQIVRALYEHSAQQHSEKK